MQARAGFRLPMHIVNHMAAPEVKYSYHVANSGGGCCVMSCAVLCNAKLGGDSMLTMLMLLLRLAALLMP